MIKEIFSIFKGDYPLQSASADFTHMLELARTMILESSAVYWGKVQTPEDKTTLLDKDIEVNRLQRKIRKAVITHLAGPNPSDVPYGLLLMSLVKDVERLGDYAKNLAELPQIAPVTLSDDELTGELHEIQRTVERLAEDAPRIFTESDTERARLLTTEGRTTMKRCDSLIEKLAKSDYDAAHTVRAVLGVRYYKRLEAHMLNLLSSMLMPLHKLDYYDEKFLDSSR